MRTVTEESLRRRLARLESVSYTHLLILKRVFGKDTEMRTLLGTMQDGIKEMETLTGIDYSPVTINRYKNCLLYTSPTLNGFVQVKSMPLHTAKYRQMLCGVEEHATHDFS